MVKLAIQQHGQSPGQRKLQVQRPKRGSSLACWRKEKKTRLNEMYVAKGSMASDKFGDDLPIF